MGPEGVKECSSIRTVWLSNPPAQRQPGSWEAAALPCSQAPSKRCMHTNRTRTLTSDISCARRIAMPPPLEAPKAYSVAFSSPSSFITSFRMPGRRCKRGNAGGARKHRFVRGPGAAGGGGQGRGWYAALLAGNGT